MATNLKFGFRESYSKHLSKYIAIDSFPSKKACLALGSDFLSRSTQPNFVVDITLSSDEKPSSVVDIPYHEIRKPIVIL